MRYIKFLMAEDGDKDKDKTAEIPADDGHQMSQSEIDALIAALLNK